jgi:hypothetical protein
MTASQKNIEDQQISLSIYKNLAENEFKNKKNASFGNYTALNNAQDYLEKAK